MRPRRLLLTAVISAAMLTNGSAALAAMRTTMAKPGMPTGVTAAARDHGALVSWRTPAKGGAVTGYVVRAAPGGKSVRTSAVNSFLVGGLANNTAYRFTVTAVNKSGSGPASRPSAAVRPRAATPPGSVRSLRVQGGFRQIAVSWIAPVNDGGPPVSSYRVSAAPGGRSVVVAGDADSAALAGLNDGTSYRVTVVAVNAAGRGSPVRSGPVMPKVTVPGVPTGVSAAPAGSGVTVGWQPPVSDGGAPLTGYVITVGGSHRTVSAPARARSVSVTGLHKGSSYTFTVSAKNRIGSGVAVASAPASAGAVLAKNTVVLSSASLAALSVANTSGALVFISPPAQVTGLKAGDLIGAGISPATPAGLMAKVTSVTIVGSTVTVDTVPASLGEVFTSAAFGVSAGLGAGQLPRVGPARAGRWRASPASAPPGSLSISLNTDLYKGSHQQKVAVSGSLTITPHVSFNAAVTCCSHSTSALTVTATAVATLSITAQVSHTIGGALQLGPPVPLPAIPLDVAGFPVVIRPTLVMKLIAKGTVTAGLHAGVAQTITFGVRASSRDGHVAASPVFQRTWSITPPTPFAGVDAAVGVQAEVDTTVDLVPGPDLTDSLWLLKLSVNPLADPWWTLSLEDQVVLEYKLKLLGLTLLDVRLTVADLVVELAHAPDPFQQVTITPDPARVAPGGKVRFHAHVSGAASQQVTWSVPAGNGTIDKAGLYQAPATAGFYEVTAVSPATGLNPGATGLVSVQVGAQPPGPPVNATATSHSYGRATITWKPPGDTGGAAISRYTVTANPGGVNVSVAGTVTSASIASLSPGGSYTFTVTAANVAGVSVPSAPTSPIIIDDVGGVPADTWTATKAPLPKGAFGGELSGVSCPAPTSCVAVGDYSDEFGLVVTGSGSSWHAATLPAPGDARDPPAEFPNAVSCSASTACGAAGSNQDSSNDLAGLVLTKSGTTWAAVHAPLPAHAGAVPNPEPDSIACPVAKMCAVTGGYAGSGEFQQVELLTWNGTSWSAIEAPMPKGASSDPQPIIGSVACPAQNFCVAAGEYSDAQFESQGVLENWNGTTWSAARAPQPPGGNGMTLNAVSCSTVSTCAAVGEYDDQSGNQHGALLTWNGTAWTASAAPVPPGVSANPGVTISTVSCAEPTGCAAAGDYTDSSGNQQGLLLTWDGASWTASKAPLPPDAAASPDVSVSSASCANAITCAAAGSYTDSAGNQQGLLVSWAGISWVGVRAPLPAGAAEKPTPTLESMSCPSATDCVIAGLYFDSSNTAQGLLLSGPGD